jgi:uncharacterized protein (DUF2164 family)
MAKGSEASIALSDETTKKLVTSIRRFFAEEREEEIGELQARLLLDFILEEIGPSVYNSAIADAQTFMRDRVADLDGACFRPELAYWGRRSDRKR